MDLLCRWNLLRVGNPTVALAETAGHVNVTQELVAVAATLSGAYALPRLRDGLMFKSGYSNFQVILCKAGAGFAVGQHVLVSPAF